MTKIDKRSKIWKAMDEDDKKSYLVWEEEQKRIKSANAGGSRPGSGRKPKADEIALIERLDSIIDKDSVIEVLATLIEQSGDIKALTLYMNYRYGRAKETKDINLNTEQPLFNIDEE